MASVSVSDLEDLNYTELTELITQANNVLATKRDDAKNALVQEMRDKAAGLGINLEDLLAKPAAPATSGRKARHDTGKTVAPKYRGPNGEEWTGRGRRPLWMSQYEGKTTEDFRI